MESPSNGKTRRTQAVVGLEVDFEREHIWSALNLARNGKPRMVAVTSVHGAGDIEDVRRLFREYWAALNVDLCFQNFAMELESLPGKYVPPKGALFLARNEAGEAIGCVALRPTETEGCCEMKRLYVAPAGRGSGLGRVLVRTVMAEARKRGYREMRLDTLPELLAAAALYRSEGFAECPPFGEPDKVKVLYFSRVL